MTSSSRSKRALLVCLLPATLLVSSTAYGQRTAQDIASARQLYGEGVELRDKGDLKGALEKFKAAHALGNTPITGLELCKVHQTLKQPVEAREACLSVGRIGPIPEESQRSKDSRTEAVKIAEAEKPKMSSIKVKLTGVPAGFQPVVAIDAVTIPSAALNEPRPVDPGSHVVTAKVGSGNETKVTVETKEGEAKDVDVAVPPPPKNEVPPPSDGDGKTTPPQKEGMRSSTKLAFGLAGLGAVIGGVAGLVAINKTSDLSDNCDLKFCGTEQWSNVDSAHKWGNVSTVAFIISGVALGAGIVMYLTGGASTPAKAAKAKTNVGFTFRGLSGTF